jgi:hydrogenase expression/formation protein HypE
VGIVIDESKLPIREEVLEACEILGLDPLYIANEGKMVVIVDEEDADTVLETIRKNPLGKMANVIGEVTDTHRGKVIMKTKIGTTKVVDMITGEQLPRIC